MELIEKERPTRTDLYGKDMETQASNFLKKLGYSILERNYKNALGEIDIIAYDKREKRIVFVEVKARKSLNYGYGREAVNAEKIRKIVNSAQLYLKSKKKTNEKMRFDVIEIMNNKIIHLKAVV